MAERGATVVRNIRFPVADWRRLQKLAKQDDREISSLVRIAVRELLTRERGGAA